MRGTKSSRFRLIIPAVIGIASVLLSRESSAQNIIQAEYFIDVDLGAGSNTSITIVNGVIIDENFTAITSALPSGRHFIYVRTKDQTGAWGFLESRTIIVKDPAPPPDPPAADINKLEYFIDDDLGPGGGTDIPVSTGSEIDLPSVLIANSMTDGFHVIGIRGRNTASIWGFSEYRRVFVKTNGSLAPTIYDVSEMEYFFDADPGQGNGNPWPGFGQSSSVDLNELVSEANVLTSGRHIMVLRAKNSDGKWGLYERRIVIVKEIVPASPGVSPIMKMEYYFDGDDQGVGNATDLPITPGPVVDLDPVNITTSPSLIDGSHTITFRAKNSDGIWGMAETSTFDVLDDCTQPTADFNPMLACAGEAVTFQDLSTDIQPDAQYRWYFDGDDIADDFTIGTTSFTFTNPGTYDIGLAISQGTICYDSIGYTIDIKAKPVVLYSVSGLIIDAPTNFDVASSNVDPGATWEWDFDNDAIIDDNTVGSTSNTYTVATTYTAALRVTDELGCETSYSKTFVVGDGSGGGGTPQADFLANPVCDGDGMQFFDISENIDPSALYSWDFDNDGSVDDNTVGNTAYAYPTPGDYTAKLTIDNSGDILVKTRTVSVKPIPTTQFSASDVCDGEIVDFTDGTTGTLPGTTYHWDFDGNGTIDSNTAGNVSYTYAQPGQYTALLLVDNGSGCFASSTLQVDVIPVPVPDFSSTGMCTGSVVSFQQLSAGITPSSIFEWDFDGDGGIDYTGKDGATHTYGLAGDYNAKLTIDNGNGCETQIIKTVSIIETPVADFEVAVGCAGDPIAFTDVSSNLSSPVYSWDFTSDGSEDDNTVGSTSFSFATPGTFTATLSVNNGGCISTITKTFVVTPVPIPAFTVSGGCSGSEFIFFDESSDLAGGSVYSWDFDGDGVEDHDQPGDAFFTYADPGTYDATLRIDNGAGCIVTIIETLIIAEVPEPSFEILSTCIGQPSQFVDLSEKVAVGATYSWDFDGDGIIDDTTVGSTSHTFDVFKPYVATLSINNGLGCIQMVDVIVDFTGAAAPDFKVGQTCLNEEVVFTDISAELAIGAVYSWDFNGDGLEDSAHPGTTTYTFTVPGIYKAALTIFNADLCSATRTISIEVSELPAVDLGPDVQLCTEGTVTLDAGVGYASYFWKGGSTEQTLTVDTFGEYWVSITDVKGCTNLDTIQVRLKDLPVAQFEYEIVYSPTDGIVVSFENQSTEADATDAWMWDFGDGGVSDDENPEYTYTEFSFYRETPYIVCLTATDRCGIQDSYCVDILLSPLSLIENADNQVKVYPNPGIGLFTIYNQNGEDLDRLFILDGNGSLIESYESVHRPVMEIDISKKPAGIYYLLMDWEGPPNQVMKRVILEKKR